MLPSLDVRFNNLIKAVEQVIGPVIPKEEKLAQEQVRLVVGHLTIMKEQWKDAVRFEAGSYRLMRGLAENLVPLVDDDQASDLRAALSETQATPEDNIDRLNAAICTLGTSIDRVILGEDGRKPLSKEARLVLLDYGEASSLRDRVWFRGNGIDPDRESLPPLEDVI
ncbi:MAG: hypothetical protein KDE63_07160 [Novosphingobium sp.]|nr:hypothetical protein [Novosphingobium sp.]